MVNSCKIVMGFIELNRRIGLNLGLHEFDYCYMAVEVSGTRSDHHRYYFSARTGNRELV